MYPCTIRLVSLWDKQVFSVVSHSHMASDWLRTLSPQTSFLSFFVFVSVFVFLWTVGFLVGFGCFCPFWFFVLFWSLALYPKLLGKTSLEFVILQFQSLNC